MNQRVNRLVKAAAAAAIATTAAATMAGAAHATTYAGSNTAYSGANSATMSDGSNYNPPPDQNLANLTKDMWTASKSVSAGVHFHPGLVSGGSSVALSIKWGNAATTSGSYNNTYGNGFAFNFPAGDGSQRWEVVNVTMTEHTSDGRTLTYTAGRSVPIKALWDVAFSPLNFTLLNDCAWIGDSNFDLYFTQTGAQGQVSFGLGQNSTHSIGEFARTWTEVGVGNDLRMASVSFWNTDFHWSGAYVEGPPPLSSQTVLPASSGTRSVSWIQEDGTNNCDARMSYNVITALRTYAV
ncbi:MAG TPA: hypothetical protein VG076_14075 [Acidimicrobiales bacterium]|jgi:hypothetical protein|nr:hypothetical protein [Acidimicrobiales bacterium]